MSLSNQNMLVSVVIPAYNFGHLIPFALNSLLAQTYSNWECIVIDDGSVDNTEAVVAGYRAKDSRIKYIKQQNQGPGAARNRGIEESTGDYIQFLDADDLLEPHKLEHQANEVMTNPNIDIVYGLTMNFKTTEETSSEIGELKADRIERPKISGSGKELVKTFLRITFFPSSSLIRRKLVLNLNMLDRSLIQAEDWDLYLRAAASGATFKYVESPPGARALIRTHGQNNTANFFRLQYYVIMMRQKFNQNCDDQELIDLNNRLLSINSEDLIYEIQNDLKKGQRKQAIQRSFKTYSLTHKFRYLVYALSSLILPAQAYIALTSARK